MASNSILLFCLSVIISIVWRVRYFQANAKKYLHSALVSHFFTFYLSRTYEIHLIGKTECSIFMHYSSKIAEWLALNCVQSYQQTKGLTAVKNWSVWICIASQLLWSLQGVLVSLYTADEVFWKVGVLHCYTVLQDGGI